MQYQSNPIGLVGYALKKLFTNFRTIIFSFFYNLLKCFSRKNFNYLMTKLLPVIIGCTLVCGSFAKTPVFHTFYYHYLLKSRVNVQHCYFIGWPGQHITTSSSFCIGNQSFQFEGTYDVIQIFHRNILIFGNIFLQYACWFFTTSNFDHCSKSVPYF